VPKGTRVPGVTIHMVDSNELPLGRKLDDDKLRYDLIPWEALDEVVDVLTFGAKKYAPENWRLVPEPRRRYVAAALRHISASMRGAKFDEQSNKSHLAHAVCSLMFALELEP
jgi:hypothetical protein